MQTETLTALITSVHHNPSEGTTRINLKRLGSHEIGDFNVEKLGKVLNCETETGNSGWAIVEGLCRANLGDTIPLR
jgi:hypothetical protein